jgi:phosphopantothenoylcysteine decarboxylase/phosphopantothenate--cysteine ligase
MSADFQGPTQAILKKLPSPPEGKMKILITAGPTYEDIDDVRFIGNRSTGNMGITIANHAAEKGHSVLLILGPSDITPEREVNTINIRSAQEMYEAVTTAFTWCDAIIMAAAVADYTPAKKFKGKIHKSDSPLTISLKRTPDILKSVVAKKEKQIIVGFSLDTELNEELALKKMNSKKMDMVVCNSKVSFATDKSDAIIYSPLTPRQQAGNSKAEVAETIISRCESLFNKTK